jgi:transcriptional regulator with XRE-family HTH domain
MRFQPPFSAASWAKTNVNELSMKMIKPELANEVKPDLALSFYYHLHNMKQGQQPEKILAANIKMLMEKHVSLNSEAKVAKAGGLSQRTVNRARNGLQVRLESLSGLSRAFGLAPWQLLVPGLDPSNPPILSLTPEEKALYERLRAAAKNLL